MFGYISADRMQLSPQQKRRYQQFSCGLCKALVKRHGARGRLAVGPDMAFLAMLLTSLQEGCGTARAGRCALHPAVGEGYIANPYVDYAADMAVALCYLDCLDNWQDERSYKDLALAKLLEGRHLSVVQKYPRQCAGIHTCLAQLHRCEAQNCQDIERVSGYWGQVMAEIFDFCRGPQGDTLRQLGMGLGRFIYLMDAYEDLADDTRAGRYNPLASLAVQPGYERNCQALLERQMAECTSAFERLPVIGQDGPLLRNILYSGVWVRYEAIQQGNGTLQLERPRHRS